MTATLIPYALAGLLLTAAPRATPPPRAPTPPPKIRVLLVTGGHDFERAPFLAMFATYPDIDVREARQPAAQSEWSVAAARSYDVLVLYDMWQDATDGARTDLINLLRAGKGLVALHHSLGSYQGWDEYRRIVGGTYLTMPRVVSGVERPASTWKDDVPHTIHLANRKHPIVRGMSDFAIVDETYAGYVVNPDVTPLLTTDDPTSGKTVGWTHRYGRSRVVYLMPGHGPSAYANPDYARLVGQSIRWAAGRRPAP